MLKQVADTLKIDQEVRQREAERVSSTEERMTAAKAGWELVRDENLGWLVELSPRVCRVDDAFLGLSAVLC
jgi:hypothetical protein